MTDECISPLRRRMIEDMTVRNFVVKTQTDYIRRVKSFAVFLGRSPDTATRNGRFPMNKLLPSAALTLCLLASSTAFAAEKTVTRSRANPVLVEALLVLQRQDGRRDL
jgi:hypothetical protein